jgi:response regulator RpfG family c-di-GMP phosphodiesterase
MPNIDGVSLCKGLDCYASETIILITLCADDRMEQQVTEGGAIRLLRKPQERRFYQRPERDAWHLKTCRLEAQMMSLQCCGP